MENKQTAVEWLVNVVQSCIAPDYIPKEIIEQAKAIEKQQIIFAQMDMFNHINQNKFGLDCLNKRDAAEEYAENYYKETYLHKDNGEQKNSY